MSLYQSIEYALQISRKCYYVKSNGQLIGVFLWPVPLPESREQDGLEINNNNKKL